MTEWEPATEAEAAMRDALRTSDQELYFRILARTELLLPVSADALAGRTAMGWGTWNSGGRTHVLSFTSTEAMRLCLAENAGSARKIAFHELADTWPNHEWWLAVNPGLPIEGYLPPWFVGQLSRGDVRLPGGSSSSRRSIFERRSSVVTPPAPPASPPPTPAAAPTHPQSGPPPQQPVNPLRRAQAVVAEPLEPDDVLDAVVVDGPEGAPSADRADGGFRGEGGTGPGNARRANFAAGRSGGGRDPIRRLRRYEASIIDATVIDAEIIESTIMGASAMEATVVDATVVESRVGGPSDPQDPDIIDATVIDNTGELRAVGQSSRGAGRASVPKAPMATAATGARRRAAAAKQNQATPDASSLNASAKPSFVPANEVEANLLAAATTGQTDNFLSTLLLAKVLIPIPTGESPNARLEDPSFPWRREVVDGQAYVVVFTSPERMKEFMGDSVGAVTAKFVQLIRVWPDIKWKFAVNPGAPVGATLPGIQIKALAAWAADVGLTSDDADAEPEDTASAPAPSTSTIIMQKPIAPSQVDYYLERGYDRASGFVHRATEIAHLRTPEELYSTLGLSYTGSPFERHAADIYVLRWAAHRGDLYRIPYGGQHEAGMRAMQGWMIERAPFRGNGFAPAERGEVIAEFKVDSIRLPHGAQMWRLTKAGERMLVAVLDADACVWRAAADVGITADWDPSSPAAIESVERPVAPPAPPSVPSSRHASAPYVPAVSDPTDDPLDPRWRGRPSAHVSSEWTASRVGER